MIKELYRKIVSENIRRELYNLRINSNNSFINRYLIKNTGLSLSLKYSKAYLKSCRNIKNFKNKYKGKRCFIMGNGPSLNKMDLELLKNEYTWGSNRCYLLYDKVSWKHNFFVSVDTRVLPDIADEVNQLIIKLQETEFFFPVDFLFDGIIEESQNTYFFNETKGDCNKYGKFSFTPSKWMASVSTVTITALQLAAYMGFNPIYLIGCDTSYKVPKTVEFENGNSELLTSTKDDDSNHFDPRYFGKGKKWHDPHVDRMFRHYRFVKQVCDKKNVKIYNATVGGNLEVFSRVDYKSLFK